ncbi:MAG: FIST N-terminal domain-containing protein [Bacteroidota bacterium]
MSNLQVGVGQSSIDDSFQAGEDAAKDALEKHEGKPEVLIVLAAMRYDHNQLLEGIKSVTGDTQMIGGTTAGEISTHGLSTNSVVIMALSSDSLEFTVGISNNMSLDEASCGVELVKNIRSKHNFEDALSLMIFPNGMGGDGVELIDSIHSAVDEKLEIIGGYLGDDIRFENTYQYYNGGVYKDAVAGLLISGSKDFITGIGVRSGFESVGNRFYCTNSDGNVVSKFDDESALDVYKEFLGEDRAEKLPGICLEYPFGLIDEKVSIEGKEYFQLRCGLSVDHEKGTISLAGSIPEGSAITLTMASRGDIIKGAELAAEQAKNSLGKAKPKVILMFSCVGRKLVLGRRTEEEIIAVRKVLGDDVPIIGFYTYGEIGPIDKMNKELSSPKFHNETVVLWALAEK